MNSRCFATDTYRKHRMTKVAKQYETCSEITASALAWHLGTSVNSPRCLPKPRLYNLFVVPSSSEANRTAFTDIQYSKRPYVSLPKEHWWKATDRIPRDARRQRMKETGWSPSPITETNVYPWNSKLSLMLRRENVSQTYGWHKIVVLVLQQQYVIKRSVPLFLPFGGSTRHAFSNDSAGRLTSASQWFFQ